MAIRALIRGLLATVLVVLSLGASASERLTRDELSEFIYAPYELGEPLNNNGVWSLLNSGGAEAGFVFETEPMAALPGFSGAPINMLVVLDLEGQFLDVRLINHNEPIFVSGLGEAPFREFLEQYQGHSISEPLVVGSPYGSGSDGGALVYLDGVTKATASVRIAHESLLAATLQIAREKMNGVATGPPAFPDPDHDEPLDWAALVDQGIATNLRVSNAEIDAAFADTKWHDDDPEATDDPEGTYLDLWIVDLGPASIARAALSEDGLEDLQRFMAISDNDEPILVIEAGRHGLVSPNFVRNTAPDWISAQQGGLPVQMRDADLFVDLHPDLPDELHDGVAMVLRADRRLGFDPSAPWEMQVQALREHGMFHPEIGTVVLTATHETPERFFERIEPPKPVPPWLEAIYNREADLLVLAPALLGLGAVLMYPAVFSGIPGFGAARLGILFFTLGFIGWWGQGQLSIVTPLATLTTIADGGSLAFLAYDPFSALIWIAVIVGFVLWGRGFFCGWLCPFGVLQELAHKLGRWARLPEWRVPDRIDGVLVYLKYVLLAGLVATALIAPQHVDKAAEIEPFKTAITVFFVREWYYVAYAVFWLVLGTVLFKGYCRYVCPLGALMAIGGLLRGRDWIKRRAECGSPCQLCRVKCEYKAIKPSGKIAYDECFQCLDCVEIFEDEKKCVPLVLDAKRARRAPPGTSPPPPDFSPIPGE
ncbi:MAG: 4Fe-4S binding protein [Rhodobacteraceae bacterium]|nr:4Fe-4S binding protein [Paracoccaceae bacterium]